MTELAARKFAQRAWLLMKPRSLRRWILVAAISLSVAISLVAGPALAQPVAASLERTYWKLTELSGEPVAGPRRSQEPHFVLQPDTRQVIGAGGCNRFFGGYVLDGDRLMFGQMAGTMMACGEASKTEQEFFRVLWQVRQARVSGRELELLDADSHPLARFEAVEAK